MIIANLQILLISGVNSDVCTKYQEAAKIVNIALQGLIGQCVPGAKIIDICEFGHTVVTAQAQKLFTKKVDGKAIDRGIAFPVCVSVNDIVCNHSPLDNEELVRHLNASMYLLYSAMHDFVSLLAGLLCLFALSVWCDWLAWGIVIKKRRETRKTCHGRSKCTSDRGLLFFYWL